MIIKLRISGVFAAMGRWYRMNVFHILGGFKAGSA
jgi:hypothetical protein